MHVDEVEIDDALVRRLLAAQFPRWAQLPIETRDRRSACRSRTVRVISIRNYFFPSARTARCRKQLSVWSLTIPTACIHA